MKKNRLLPALIAGFFIFLPTLSSHAALDSQNRFIPDLPPFWNGSTVNLSLASTLSAEQTSFMESLLTMPHFVVSSQNYVDRRWVPGQTVDGAWVPGYSDYDDLGWSLTYILPNFTTTKTISAEIAFDCDIWYPNRYNSGDTSRPPVSLWSGATQPFKYITYTYNYASGKFTASPISSSTNLSFTYLLGYGGSLASSWNYGASNSLSQGDYRVNIGYVMSGYVDNRPLGHNYPWWKGTGSIGVPPAAQQFQITPSAGSGGGISPASVQTVVKGGSITFNFSPNSGMQVDRVLVNGSYIGAMSSYTFSNVNADASIRVEFKSIGSGSSSGGSSSTPSGDGDAPWWNPPGDLPSTPDDSWLPGGGKPSTPDNNPIIPYNPNVNNGYTPPSSAPYDPLPPDWSAPSMPQLPESLDIPPVASNPFAGLPIPEASDNPFGGLTIPEASGNPFGGLAIPEASSDPFAGLAIPSFDFNPFGDFFSGASEDSWWRKWFSW